MFKERMNVVTKILAIQEPLIKILPKALEKMSYYVRHCDKEIGWLGTVQAYANNIFLITDVMLFKQEVHSATCEITPDGLSDFATELLSQDDGVEIWNNIKLWGHSHVNMGVSPSAQDNSQMKTFGEHNDWFIRVIANKSGEMEFTLYDFKGNLTYENVKWSEYKPYSKDLEEEVKAEMKEKVTEKKYGTVVYGNGYQGGHYGYGKRWWEDDVDTKKNTSHQLKIVGTEKEIKVEEDSFWNETTIPAYFSESEMMVIANVKSESNAVLAVHDIIDAINAECNSQLEATFEEALGIVEFAKNRYPR